MTTVRGAAATSETTTASVCLGGTSSSSPSIKAPFLLLLPVTILLTSQFSSRFVMPTFEFIPTTTTTTATTTAILLYPFEARIWQPFPISESSICHAPPPHKFKFNRQTASGFPLWEPYHKPQFKNQPQMYQHGFLFNKPMKVGGSTMSGVLMHLAKNLAEAEQQQPSSVNNNTSTSVRKNDNTYFPMCDGIFSHTPGRLFRNRTRGSSYLMSLVRDPTARAISHFYHMGVSRDGLNATLDNFRTYAWEFRNYYVRKHATEFAAASRYYWRADLSQIDDYNMTRLVNAILDDHDFIAVTERFDESMVVLQMLFDVPLGNMLYLKAKKNGGYDGGGSKEGCVFIQPSNPLPQPISDYLKSPEWTEGVVWWDDLLYRTVNASLDATIDRLGRSAFEQRLSQYQHAQRVVRDRCSDTAIFPCSETGEHRKPADTNCLHIDQGCGYPCIDEVANQLKLY